MEKKTKINSLLTQVQEESRKREGERVWHVFLRTRSELCMCNLKIHIGMQEIEKVNYKCTVAQFVAPVADDEEGDTKGRERERERERERKARTKKVKVSS